MNGTLSNGADVARSALAIHRLFADAAAAIHLRRAAWHKVAVGTAMLFTHLLAVHVLLSGCGHGRRRFVAHESL